MKKPIISIIAAIDEKRGIGKDNKLLWHIPEDLKRFKARTLGHPIIMGRTTFESIGRPLPNRTNIIVTRDPNYRIKGCLIAHSLEEALRQASLNHARDEQGKPGDNEVFIIGGGQIYAQAIDLADKLYLTLVHGVFDADTFFPDYSKFSTIISQEKQNYGNYRYTFFELVPKFDCCQNDLNSV